MVLFDLVTWLHLRNTFSYLRIVSQHGFHVVATTSVYTVFIVLNIYQKSFCYLQTNAAFVTYGKSYYIFMRYNVPTYGL